MNRNRQLILHVLYLAPALTFASCSEKEYHVPTGTMSPTIPAGTDVVVDRDAYRNTTPVRWDIVTFEPPKTANGEGNDPPEPAGTYIMRVVGLPGETVEFGGAEILVDGKPISPPATLKGIRYLGFAALNVSSTPRNTKTVLADNEYFVLGDNTTNSWDSRFWGAVPRENISGKFDVP